MPAPCAKIAVRAAKHVRRETNRNGIVTQPERIAANQLLQEHAEPEPVQIAQADIALESITPNVQRAAVSLIQRRAAAFELEDLCANAPRRRSQGRAQTDQAQPTADPCAPPPRHRHCETARMFNVPEYDPAASVRPVRSSCNCRSTAWVPALL